MRLLDIYTEDYEYHINYIPIRSTALGQATAILRITMTDSGMKK